MHSADAPKEIADLNLASLLLAQKLLQEDRAGAMERLGVSAELADMLLGMALADVMKIASSNFVPAAFRLHELPVFRSVVRDAQDRAQQAARHAGSRTATASAP